MGKVEAQNKSALPFAMDESDAGYHCVRKVPSTKYQVPSSKKQLMYFPWNLELGIWDFGLYTRRVSKESLRDFLVFGEVEKNR